MIQWEKLRGEEVEKRIICHENKKKQENRDSETIEEQEKNRRGIGEKQESSSRREVEE